MRIRLVDERGPEPRDVEFHSSEGLAEFVAYLNRAQTVLHAPIVLASRDEERAVEVEVALQYNDSISEMVVSYCNNINTIEGGTHLTGFRTALTRTLNQYAKDSAPANKKDLTITGEDFKEGLTAIISVKVPDPQFESQTKIKLANAEVEGIVTGSSTSGWASSSRPTRRRPSGSSSRRSSRPRPARRRARPASWCATARACSPAAGSPAS